MEDSTNYTLQGIISLSSDTFKDALFRLGVNISELPKLKKHTVMVDIGVSVS